MKFNFKIIRTLAAAFLAFSLSACRPPVVDNGKPNVVATIFPYYDILRSVGGDKINALIVIPPFTEVHDFSASPIDAEKIKSAKLIIKNGLGLEDSWKFLDASSAKILSIGDSVGTSLGPTSAPSTSNILNPHVWLDPVKMIAATKLIRDSLINLDPANKSTYEANADKYLADLTKLDADFSAATKSFSKKSFIGYHDAYIYLATRYGLEETAALEGPDEGGLAPAQVALVTQLINDKKATVVFAEDELSRKKVADIIAKTGATTGTLLPLEIYDNLNQTYVSLMQKNLDSLTAAMK